MKNEKECCILIDWIVTFRVNGSSKRRMDYGCFHLVRSTKHLFQYFPWSPRHYQLSLRVESSSSPWHLPCIPHQHPHCHRQHNRIWSQMEVEYIPVAVTTMVLKGTCVASLSQTALIWSANSAAGLRTKSRGAPLVLALSRAIVSKARCTKGMR